MKVWFDCVLWMLCVLYVLVYHSLIEWLVFVNETEGKRGLTFELTLGVIFHSMQRSVHFVA